MLKAQVEKITPEMAANYLKFNTDNYRKMKRPVVLRYAEEMKAGRWQLNGEAIEFNEDGTLINGQHRLAAIVYSGVTVELLVVRNVKNHINVYDDGSNRTVDQMMNAANVECNSTIVAAANIVVNQFSYTPSKGLLREYITKNESELNRAYRATCNGGNKHSKTAPCLAASYIMLRTGEIAYYELELFWRIYNAPMVTKYDGYDASPVFRIIEQMKDREKFSNGRQLQKERLELLVMAMQDFHAGNHRDENYSIREPFVFEKLIKQVRKMDKLEG
jgi:hypothetical protein